jgi:SurA N-terminal domain
MFSNITNRFAATTLLLAPVLFLVSCAEKDPKSPKFVVVKGTGVEITRAQLDEAKEEFLKQRGAKLADVPPERIAELEKSLCERLATEKLLEKEASSMKFPNLDTQIKAEQDRLRKMFPDEKTFKAEMEKAGMTEEKIAAGIRKQVTFKELIEQKVPAGEDPNPEKIAAFYKENERVFQQPATVKASHVLIKLAPDATPAVKGRQTRKLPRRRDGSPV